MDTTQPTDTSSSQTTNDLDMSQVKVKRWSSKRSIKSLRAANYDDLSDEQKARLDEHKASRKRAIAKYNNKPSVKEAKKRWDQNRAKTYQEKKANYKNLTPDEQAEVDHQKSKITESKHHTYSKGKAKAKMTETPKQPDIQQDINLAQKSTLGFTESVQGGSASSVAYIYPGGNIDAGISESSDLITTTYSNFGNDQMFMPCQNIWDQTLMPQDAQSSQGVGLPIYDNQPQEDKTWDSQQSASWYDSVHGQSWRGAYANFQELPQPSTHMIPDAQNTDYSRYHETDLSAGHTILMASNTLPQMSLDDNAQYSNATLGCQGNKGV